MRRRTVLAVGGSAVVATLAGCLDSGDDRTESPEAVVEAWYELEDDGGFADSDAGDEMQELLHPESELQLGAALLTLAEMADVGDAEDLDVSIDAVEIDVVTESVDRDEWTGLEGIDDDADIALVEAAVQRSGADVMDDERDVTESWIVATVDDDWLLYGTLDLDSIQQVADVEITNISLSTLRQYEVDIDIEGTFNRGELEVRLPELDIIGGLYSLTPEEMTDGETTKTVELFETESVDKLTIQLVDAASLELQKAEQFEDLEPRIADLWIGDTDEETGDLAVAVTIENDRPFAMEIGEVSVTINGYVHSVYWGRGEPPLEPGESRTVENEIFASMEAGEHDIDVEVDYGWLTTAEAKTTVFDGE